MTPETSLSLISLAYTLSHATRRIWEVYDNVAVGRIASRNWGASELLEQRLLMDGAATTFGEFDSWR